MTDLQKIIRYLDIKSLYLLTKSKKRKEKRKTERKKANYKASSKQQKWLDWKINELFNYKLMIEFIEII